MDHTVVLDSAAASAQLTSLAVGYQTWQTSANIGNLNFLSVYAPAIGIVSTVGDLYLWIQALSTQNLLSQASLTQLFMDQGSTNTLGSLCTNILPMATSSVCPDFAYEWYLGKESGHKAIESVAFFFGYAGYMQYFPDDHYIIVVLSNLQNADFSTVGPALESVMIHLPPT
jgi:CubicO group peptidase (beta-lactamase class C family)